MGLTIASILSNVLWVYGLIVVVRVLMSWVPNLDYNNPIVQFLMGVTEPVLRPIRNVLPAMGGFDFSPLILLVGIQVLQRLVWMVFASF